jgi:hypothetical protein
VCPAAIGGNGMGGKLTAEIQSYRNAKRLSTLFCHVEHLLNDFIAE